MADMDKKKLEKRRNILNSKNNISPVELSKTISETKPQELKNELIIKKTSMFKDFWKITNKEHRRLRISAWVIAGLFFISYLFSINSINTNFKSYSLFWRVFAHFFMLIFITIIWFITFYLLKLFRNFLDIIDPNYKMNYWTEKIIESVPFVILFIFMCLIYMMGYAVMIGMASIPFFKQIFGKTPLFLPYIIIILLAMMGIIITLFYIKKLLLELFRPKETTHEYIKSIYQVIEKINPYFIIALGLTISVLIGGIIFINQINKYNLPIEAHNSDINLTCNGHFPELISNLPLTCTLNINLSSPNHINLTKINFLFISNNGTKQYCYILINNNQSMQLSELIVPHDTFMLTTIYVEYINSNLTQYQNTYKPVYTYSDYEQKTQERFFWFFGLLSICFFTIFSGVSNIKQILKSE